MCACLADTRNVMQKWNDVNDPLCCAAIGASFPRTAECGMAHIASAHGNRFAIVVRQA